MANHTPGPWVWRPTADAEECPNHIRNYRLGNGEDGSLRVGMMDFMTKIDAALIAATPDLLAALKLLIDRHDDQMLTALDWETAKAAVRKAEGEQ